MIIKILDFFFENKDGCFFWFSMVIVFVELIEVVLCDEVRVIIVGVEVKDVYGLENFVFISVLVVIGVEGVRELFELYFLDDE